VMTILILCSATGRMGNSQQQRLIRGKQNSRLAANYGTVTKIAEMIPCYGRHRCSLYDNKLESVKLMLLRI